MRLQWRRERFEWEIPPTIDFLQVMQHVVMDQFSEDKVLWKGSLSGTFSIKEAYILISTVSSSDQGILAKVWQVHCYKQKLCSMNPSARGLGASRKTR